MRDVVEAFELTADCTTDPDPFVPVVSTLLNWSTTQYIFCTFAAGVIVITPADGVPIALNVVVLWFPTVAVFT